MKKLIYLLIAISTISFIASCKDNKADNTTTLYECPMHCEGDKTYDSKGSCPVCKMDLVAVSKADEKIVNTSGISDESIFNLESIWHTQNDEAIHLEDLKGKTLVMVMIYTSCKAACPRLVADIRHIEAEIPKAYDADIQYVMISIDPKNDTPKKLKEFAKENYMEDGKWLFLQGSESSVRELANVLAVKYKQISPLDFSHSNIISVFDPNGDLVHQQEGLGVDNKETVKSILSTVSKS